MISYDPPLFRPPSEGENLIIQATLGCSFNACGFCSMYRTKTYTVRPLEDVFADIDTAAEDCPDAHRVFLADGDALALPTDHLLALLVRLAERLGNLNRVSAYATPADLLRKTPEELAALKAAKLTLVYLGVETGYPPLLKIITKGASVDGVAGAIDKARQAGMKVSATVILGLGGKAMSYEHAKATAALINRAPPNFLSTLQLFLEPDREEDFIESFKGTYIPADDEDALAELTWLLEDLAPPKPIIFRSNHGSNALPLAGVLPKDRGRLLQEVEAAKSGQLALRPRRGRSL